MVLLSEISDGSQDMGKTSNKLSYDDFQKKIARNEISPIYIFTGDQTYLMDQAVSELKKKVLGTSDDFNFSLFYGDSASAENIIDTAKTYPMLSKMRLVVVRNAEKLNPKNIKSIESYLSSPSATTSLVLMFNEEKKLTFDNNDSVSFVTFSVDAKDITQTIRIEARKLGFDISREAAETLSSLVGDDLQDIHSELQKLALYATGKNKIESGDVVKLTEKSQFEDVFKLLNAIMEKNKKKALSAVLNLESRNEEPIAILNSIGRRLGLIWRAKELLDSKAPDNAIAKELKISPGALYYIKQDAKKFSYKDLKRAVDIIYEGDRRLKTVYVPKNMALTKIVLELCGS